MGRGAGPAIALIAASMMAVPGWAQNGASRGADGEATGGTGYGAVLPVLSMIPAPDPYALETADRKGQAQTRGSPVGGYSRIEIVFTPSAEMKTAAARVYDREERGWWRRAFAGKSVARLLALKTTLSRPQLSITTPLASIAHDSKRDVGENWSTELTGRRAVTPYFRIDADSSVSLEAALTATSSYDASVASTLLDVMRRAVQLVAPTAALVTSLSDNRYDQAAQFVNQSIANAFKQSVGERKLDDFALKQWAGAKLAEIAVMLPMGNDMTPRPGDRRARNRAIAIGTWTVSAAPATLSIFSDQPFLDPATIAVASTRARPSRKRGKSEPEQLGCTSPAYVCAAFTNLSPAAVMNFPVAANVALSQALAGTDAIATARDRLVAATANKGAAAEADAARALCGLVAGKAHALGFNRYDVAAIVWAYANDSFATDLARDALADEGRCPPLALAFAMGLPRDGFTAEGAGVAVVPPAPAAVQPSAPVAPPAGT